MRGISPVPAMVTTGKISTLAFLSFYIDVYLNYFITGYFYLQLWVLRFIQYTCQIHFKMDECHLQVQRLFLYCIQCKLVTDKTLLAECNIII